SPAYRFVQFVSPPIATGFTWASGTAGFSLTMGTQESGTGVDARTRIALFQWNANDTLGANFRNSLNGAEMGTSRGSQTITFSTTAAVTFAPGDRIVLEVEIGTVTPAAGTATQWWGNATSNARLVMPTSVKFAYGDTSATAPARHNVSMARGVHDPSNGEGLASADGSMAAASRHVECEDCHNPHAAAPIAAGAYAGAATGYAAGTPDTLTDSTKAWGVNALKGWTVKIVAGTGAGQTSVVYANAATTLSVAFGTAPAAGSTYVLVPRGVRNTGNQVSGAQAGVWGLAPTFPAQPSPPNWNDGDADRAETAAEITTQFNAIATWGRTDAVTVMGGLCVKCHSYYAYGASPPNTPSGAGTSTNTTWSDTTGAATAQSDIASQFNPNNLGHHAIFARGKNQPLVSSDATTSTYNTNWPKFTTGTVTATNGSPAVTGTSAWPATVLPGWFIYIGSIAPSQDSAGWYEVAAVPTAATLTLDRNYTGATGPGKAFMLTAGLGNNFVPPYGPWSTLVCTDCHESDTTTDPFGPHASGTKWLLKKFTSKTFSFWSGAALTTITTAPGDANNLCLNCHRRDVYGDYEFMPSPSAAGDPPYYSRQTHPCDDGVAFEVKPKWGIVCLNCHGGARIGTIHGSNLGRGANGAAGSYSGKRLLAGAHWYGVTRSQLGSNGACWTKGGTDTVTNCSRAHTNQVFESSNYLGVKSRANYDYDTSP
ncbi:MAG: hypothetical protein AABZ30_08110, partial [Myxococcota bacterium]